MTVTPPTSDGPTKDDIAAVNAELVLHSRFIRKVGGRAADLSHRNLTGLSLKRLRLDGCRFTGATLARANLSGSDLSGADLFCADLEGADLTGANLTGADLRGANLHQATLTFCNLRGADFRSGFSGPGEDGTTRLTEAKLINAILCDAKMVGCDLSGADLVDADFNGADLSRAIMLGADLSGASFANAKFGGTVVELSRLSPVQLATANGGLAGMTYWDMTAKSLEDVLAQHKLWIDTLGAGGKRLDLDGVRIKGAKIGPINLSGARLRRCCFVAGNFQGVTLDMADLSYSDFTGAIMEEGSFRGTSFRRASLSRALLAGSCFDAMPLDGGRKWPTNFDGAILHDADLTNATFEGALMPRADVGGAIMQGVSMRGVDKGVLVKSAPGEHDAGPKERRRVRRHTTPVLFASAGPTVFRCLDWGFGGLCLQWPKDIPVLPVGATFSLRLVDRDRGALSSQVDLIVTDTNPKRAALSFKYVVLPEDVKDYLNALLPTKYRKK